MHRCHDRRLFSTNLFGRLVRIVAVFLLERLDESGILLLRLFRGETLVDKLLPRVLLGFCLCVPFCQSDAPWELDYG